MICAATSTWLVEKKADEGRHFQTSTAQLTLSLVLSQWLDQWFMLMADRYLYARIKVTRQRLA